MNTVIQFIAFASRLRLHAAMLKSFMHPLLAMRLIVIMSLLLVQAGGLLHTLSHLHSDDISFAEISISTSDAGAHDQHCDLCDAYNQISSSIITLSVDQGAFSADSHITALCTSYITSTPIVFSARAPPLLPA
ncbi:MAG: hypothetical protein CO186_12355 [Zetaproteobacteria bacterium CG_4_9_14_3_um_filter_49_83]|nr:MAG: hypothetical protein AUJ56_09990 [Zetaproteobacteria bacterium CG1_02_49_23]PIQ34220.1 MAG: hypothetical protein COW62_02620 [Zetaproteobacteria bacterium CG17_big_fil_post_rev_8_21_14_2_50_50_13]PIV31082.1 MAG: hypothetical protein COS35_03320 [Zetaproteobacteria bacterium CG02_land_8_20_14_3_00_50_9]PIY57139.1 MAG: hypothetical protein COZ00_00475 [Zetaproteobacteria bacterium CG_4_10_14_0_8_um_filter_49_80]PJA33955.1 MAG: hypothetical protein CO186_12355 [Zetaproteobacteria bacterium